MQPSCIEHVALQVPCRSMPEVEWLHTTSGIAERFHFRVIWFWWIMMHLYIILYLTFGFLNSSSWVITPFPKRAAEAILVWITVIYQLPIFVHILFYQILSTSPPNVTESHDEVLAHLAQKLRDVGSELPGYCVGCRGAAVEQRAARLSEACHAGMVWARGLGWVKFQIWSWQLARTGNFGKWDVENIGYVKQRQDENCTLDAMHW